MITTERGVVNRTLIGDRWLLALCGLLEATYGLVNLFAPGPHGSVPLVVLGRLALAAGVCAVVAGIWRFKDGISWLLALHGLAVIALGALLLFWTGPLAFRTIALLFVLMAISAGIFAFTNAQTAGHRWFLLVTGAASVGFALAFLALGFDWANLPRQNETLNLWMSSYFALSAAFMVGLAFGTGLRHTGGNRV
jgi:uncharacterized membrane protein HdeD (DUF308 family)